MKDKKTIIRRAVRAVLFDDLNKFAVLEVKGEGGIYYKIPGGTIEKNETKLEAFKREMLEEAGCNSQILYMVGRHQFFVKKRNKLYKSICYLAKVIGQKSEPKFDDWEQLRGFKILWINPMEALKKFKNIKTTDSYEIIIQKRDGAFFEKGLRLLEDLETI